MCYCLMTKDLYPYFFCVFCVARSACALRVFFCIVYSVVIPIYVRGGYFLLCDPVSQVLFQIHHVYKLDTLFYHDMVIIVGKEVFYTVRQLKTAALVKL